MSDTVKQMRLLASAVPGENGGVPYQPITPSTLLSWANEIEELEMELSNLMYESMERK